MGKQANGRDPNISKASPKIEIAQILEAHRGEYHVIVLHDFPDPDAIASGFAHQVICAAFDIQTDILYGGRISHEQNIALVHMLGLDLHAFEGKLPKKYDAAVFVDNQGANAMDLVKALKAEEIETLLIVDHHEPQELLQPQYSDIRPVGSTSTIYVSYLNEEEIFKLDQSNTQLTKMATALMHGLISDTSNFVYAKKEDFRAAAILSDFVDSEILSQILTQARSKQVMETIYQSLANHLVVENYSIAGIGYLRAQDRDAIPQAADFLLTEANVHTAIIYGIVALDDGEESLVGSLRTNKITIDPDEFVKDVFGKDAEGNYYGGGKLSAAGFEIPIGFLSGHNQEDYKDLKWQVYDSQVKHRLFDRIGIQED
ncbi:MAG: bifunctional oligoribonuclease/PAP phosphatase NrnA [Candidatus Promineifilaceae bacterium]|jgi:nanoRNase/pAp phosphatase (c-di-AMP/oligoRNAs hydrolase)